jgi:hypothetical protein
MGSQKAGTDLSAVCVRLEGSPGVTIGGWRESLIFDLQNLSRASVVVERKNLFSSLSVRMVRLCRMGLKCKIAVLIILAIYRGGSNTCCGFFNKWSGPKLSSL